MPPDTNASSLKRLISPSGLRVEIHDTGSIRRIDYGEVLLNLFVGNELEGGPANLYLRRHSDTAPGIEFTPLLGPASPTRTLSVAENIWAGGGEWRGIRYSVKLQLAERLPAWFWHVQIENVDGPQADVDLIYAQDIALAPYAVVRLNEYYVSQYIDHTALQHRSQGWVVGSRQNLPAAGRNPWCMIGSLRRAAAFATDAMQVHGLATRAGVVPAVIGTGLSSRRLQHEHSMVAIQSGRVKLQQQPITLGFFGAVAPDHPEATSVADLAVVDAVIELPEATLEAIDAGDLHDHERSAVGATLFTSAPSLSALELDAVALRDLFPGEWRHKETDASGKLLSFFHGRDRHVVLRSKEMQTLRPHGHLLRTGRGLTPDESALTSTTWMAGVFHSMLTQGHVSINRLLSTVHSYLGLFRSHGQRIFVDVGTGWELLDVPSAFEMAPAMCRWIYRHAHGVIEVRSEARSDPHEMLLDINVLSGPAVRSLITHHVAINGDDGSRNEPVLWSCDATGICIRPVADSDVGRRFPEGFFQIAPTRGARIEQVGGDELLFGDGRSRRQPYICVVTARAMAFGLCFRGHLTNESTAGADDLVLPQITLSAQSALASQVAQLSEILPWYAHNALIHYLSPRGLEQYSGGGWGTRDVTQGPVEMLLALGVTDPVRDLLLRVMSAQNADGDWPQWFMFFDRERGIRAPDSHGDIVFWPLLALAQYLIASGDAGLLDGRVPFFTASRETAEPATIWQHVQRALAIVEQRIIAGTALAAYGHGDWNDSLQPADPAMREHMCSAWTVTLHYQTLTTLGRALRLVGRTQEAGPLEIGAAAVQRDFQRLLLTDGVLAGYVVFEGEQVAQHLLHPRDAITGVHYSSLAMIHAILEGMLTKAQAQAHLQLLRTKLSGPDGVRLFDRPMNYHGGPQRFFQRAESATFFGREIGLMYMHAHLRYAQALAHVGDAEGFFHALCQANPIALKSIVPTATLRQANCYYSSSDAAFTDRYQASADYDAIKSSEIALDGGWRVYSSGAGIALSLIVRRFLGLSCEFESLVVDPVMPVALDGLKVQTRMLDREFEVSYTVRPPGYGVTAVTLNGYSLPLSYESNPYRGGAARISAPELVGHLVPGRNVLVIDIGRQAQP